MRNIFNVFDVKHPRGCFGTYMGFGDYFRGTMRLFEMYPDDHVVLYVNERLAISKVFKNIQTFSALEREVPWWECGGCEAVIAETPDGGDCYITTYHGPSHGFYTSESPALEKSRRLFEYQEPYHSMIDEACADLTGGKPYRVITCRCGDYVFEGNALHKSNVDRVVRALLAEKEDMPCVLICDYPEVTHRVLRQRPDFIQKTFEPCYLSTYTGSVEGCIPLLTAYRLLFRASRIRNYGRWVWGDSQFALTPARLYNIPYQGVRLCLE